MLVLCQNNESLVSAVQKFHAIYGWNSILTLSTEKRLFEKFKDQLETLNTLVVQNQAKTNVTIKAVHESVVEHPKILIRCRGEELQITRSSV